MDWEKLLKALEEKMTTAVDGFEAKAKIIEALEEKMKDAGNNEEVKTEIKSIKEETKSLIEEIKKLQTQIDDIEIKNDTTGTKGAEIQERKEFSNEFRGLLTEVKSGTTGTQVFEIKAVNTTEVAELGGIITKTEKDTNVIEFPQASNQFVNDVQEVMISGKSITFILEDPSFDSNFSQLTDADIDLFWTGENEDVLSNTGEKFEEVEISVHKMTVLITMTNEMVDDAAFDIVAYTQRKIQQRVSFKQLIGFTIGTGKKSPKGILKSDRVNVVEGKITKDDIWETAINLEHGISEEYREGGKYYMHDNVWRDIKIFKDADGRPLMVRGMNIVDATANTLNGKPVVTNVAMSTDITTVGSTPMMFANLKVGYTKVMRKTMEFLIDKLTKKGFTKLYGEARVGGDVVSKNAIAKLEIIA